MATVSRATLRANLGRATGLFVSGATTSAGTTTTAVDTSIVRYSTNLLANKWLLMTSGDASGESRLISSVSSSTITVNAAFSAATGSGDTYTILPYDPKVYDDAIAQAVRTAMVDLALWVPIRNESLVVDNILSNNDMATFSGGFTGWTEVGSPTVTQETENSATFARIVASGAAGVLEQDLITLLNLFKDAHTKTMHVSGWVRCDTADAARLRVTFDGSTYTSSDFHDGSNTWQRLHFTASITSGLSEATVSCEVEDGSTGDFDLLAVWVGPVTHYTLPDAIEAVNGPHLLTQQERLDEPGGLFLPLGPNNPPKSGHLLRLETMGNLSEPDSDDDTIAVSEQRGEYILARAAEYTYRTLKRLDAGNREQHQADQQQWNAYADRIRERPGLRQAPMSANLREYWRTLHDSSGKYLVLSRARG